MWRSLLPALVNNQDIFIEIPTYIRGTQDSNVIHGSLESQVIDARGNDVIYAGDGGDFILAGEGNDRLDGQTNDAILIGADKQKQTIGTPDYLTGGAGEDTFVVDFGFGPLNVNNIEGYQVLNEDIVSNGVFIITDYSPSIDSLKIAGNNFNDLIFEEDVSIKSSFGDEGQSHNGLLISNITTKTAALINGADIDDLPALFDDYIVRVGSIISDTLSNESSISPALFYGGEGNDILEGNENFGDHLIGGAGNDELRPMGNKATPVSLTDEEIIEISGNPDILLGGLDEDTFKIDADKGGVIFIDDYDAKQDSIKVHNIDFSDINFEYSIKVHDDFEIRNAVRVDLGITQLFVQGDFNVDAPINIIAFEGEDENNPYIARPLGEDVDVALTALGDQYFGTFNNENITGLQGDDRIKGSVGSDIIHGGKGNDILKGGIGIDTIKEKMAMISYTLMMMTAILYHNQ